jgi:hypothetical protein
MQSPDQRAALERPPLLTVTVERTYRFDVERIMRDFGDDIRRDMADFDQDLDEALRTTFWELCGTWADKDHVDGRYVWLEDSDGNLDFGWDEIVKQAEEINDARA